LQGNESRKAGKGAHLSEFPAHSPSLQGERRQRRQGKELPPLNSHLIHLPAFVCENSIGRNEELQAASLKARPFAARLTGQMDITLELFRTFQYMHLFSSNLP